MAVLRNEHFGHSLDSSTLGSALFLSAVVMCTVLGLKLKWFRASINFDHPPSSTNNVVVNKNNGVYRPFQNNDLAFGNQQVQVSIPSPNKRLHPTMVKLPPSQNAAARPTPAAGQSTSSTQPVQKPLQSALKKSNGSTDPAPLKSATANPSPQQERPDSLPLIVAAHPIQLQAAKPITNPLSQPNPPPQQTSKVPKPSPRETPQPVAHPNKQNKPATLTITPGSTRPKSLFSLGSSSKLSVAEKKQEKEQQKMEAQRLKEGKEHKKQQQKQAKLNQKNQNKNKGAKAEPVANQRPYSTGTIGSTLSTSTAPPPYSETVSNSDMAPKNLSMNPNDATGNTSYGGRVPEASSWDMVSQHRKQMQRPVGSTRVGDNKDLNNKRESRFEYNVGRSPFLPHIEHEGKTEV